MKYEFGDEFKIKHKGVWYHGMITNVEGCMIEFSWKYPDRRGGFKYYTNVVDEATVDKEYLKGLIK